MSLENVNLLILSTAATTLLLLALRLFRRLSLSLGRCRSRLGHLLLLLLHFLEKITILLRTAGRFRWWLRLGLLLLLLFLPER